MPSPSQNASPEPDAESLGEITRLLQQWSEGDREALQKVTPMIYQKLRQLAAYHFKKESPGHTLQVTALVHEAYLQLAGGVKASFANREQFYLFAGQVMRRLLVGHARGRLAKKRGGDHDKIAYEEKIELADHRGLDLSTFLALDQAITRLERVDPRQGRIVTMRFFAGLTNEEIAKALGVAVITVKREWRAARCWLSLSLKEDEPPAQQS